MMTMAGLIGGLGLPELLIVLALVVLIFGAGKIPQLGKGLGEGIRNFKKGIKGDDPQQLRETSESAKD